MKSGILAQEALGIVTCSSSSPVGSFSLVVTSDPEPILHLIDLRIQKNRKHIQHSATVGGSVPSEIALDHSTAHRFTGSVRHGRHLTFVGLDFTKLYRIPCD